MDKHKGGCKMKVSIDGILGSARKINSQREMEKESLDKKKKEVKVDSVNIGSRVNSRVDNIENEIREVQSSLTKGQVIRNGIEELSADLAKGGEKQNQIMEEVKFSGESILKDFITGQLDEKLLSEKRNEVNELINTDVTKLRKLQVEVDNIMASNLAGNDKADTLMESIDKYLSGENAVNPDSISSLNPDSVMRLIR